MVLVGGAGAVRPRPSPGGAGPTGRATPRRRPSRSENDASARPASTRAAPTWAWPRAGSADALLRRLAHASPFRGSCGFVIPAQAGIQRNAPAALAWSNAPAALAWKRGPGQRAPAVRRSLPPGSAQRQLPALQRRQRRPFDHRAVGPEPAAVAGAVPAGLHAVPAHLAAHVRADRARRRTARHRAPATRRTPPPSASTIALSPGARLARCSCWPSREVVLHQRPDGRARSPPAAPSTPLAGVKRPGAQRSVNASGRAGQLVRDAPCAPPCPRSVRRWRSRWR